MLCVKRKVKRANMELEQLRNLDAIARSGTLSKAAADLHLSQSALSRSVQRLESELGLQLFERTKNRMALNDAGALAVERARAVLAEVGRMEESLHAVRDASRVLRVGSCAPAPLWRLVPAVAEREPGLVVMPEMLSVEALEQGLLAGSLDFAILPHEPALPTMTSIPLMSEDLFVALPEDHPLSGSAELSLADLDGETFLLYAGIGFWREVCERHMPRAHYVVQNDYVVFSQLSQASPLPGFVTNASESERIVGRRRIVPLTDEDVHVRFRLVAVDRPGFCHRELMTWLAQRLALG